MEIAVENNVIKNIRIIGSCPGNILAVSRLCINGNIDDVIKIIKGIKCGNKNTSCPNELAIALEKNK